MRLAGNIVDVVGRRVFCGEVEFAEGVICEVRKAGRTDQSFILPGFVDSHIHIESSMLPPSEFARVAACHGTVACVCDPHEIANVLGLEGVKFMVQNGKEAGMKFCFGAPSCVPATPFESSGASIGPIELEELFRTGMAGFLSEMMNFPGVIGGDKSVLAKIEAAKRWGKVVDGHAPGLRGEALAKYIAAGISTDHECFSLEEALEKADQGMKVSIREGSAARNFEALVELIKVRPEMAMLCSDDKHPDELVLGHIDVLVARAIACGVDPLAAIRAGSLNPVRHYGLPVGLLQRGDPADFIVVDDLRSFNILATYVNGVKIAEKGKSLLEHQPAAGANRFGCRAVTADDLRLKMQGKLIWAIEVLDGQLVTEKFRHQPKIVNGDVVSDVERDLLKLVVVNRYQDRPPAISFVKNMGLKEGALASSVAHDSHNIVAVGVNDEDLVQAINLVIQHRGAIAAVCANRQEILPLPLAGLMSNLDAWEVARKYRELDGFAKELGSQLSAPFMTMSFLALLVIPKLKLSDKGLFDAENFKFISSFVE